MKRSLCASVLLLAPSQVLSAPICGENQICGEIVDEEGKPLSFAEVEYGADQNASFALTDENGWFAIDKPSDAEPELVSARLIGFDSTTLAFSEFLAQNSRLVLKSQGVAAPKSGDSIVVTARGRSRPFASRSLTSMDIVTDPLASADVLLAVSGLAVSTNVNNSADVQLRGGAVGLSRIYFNDVPLYEAVRGSSVDQTTRLFSIFDPRILSSVETYPTNPPAYLANSAAGAVRALPQYDTSGNTSVLVGASGVKIASSQPVFDNGSAQLYANLEDIWPLLQINPQLRDSVITSSSQSLGTSISLPTPNDGEVTFFGALDREDGKFPLRILNQSGIASNDRLRAYGIVGWETVIGDDRLKFDGAYTYSKNKFDFNQIKSSSRNRYVFSNVDLAGSFLKQSLQYRVGVTYELFSLASKGATSLSSNSHGLLDFTSRIKPFYIATYAFLTSPVTDQINLQAGTRQFIVDSRNQNAMYSLGLTFRSADKKHKVILGLGQYSALIPPELGNLQSLQNATSKQASIDYLFTVDNLDISAGLYLKKDRVESTVVNIFGMDAELDAKLTNWLDLSLRFATSDHRSQDFTGDNDLDYQFRAILKARPNLQFSITGSVTYRSGAVFTPVIASSADPAFGTDWTCNGFVPVT